MNTAAISETFAKFAQDRGLHTWKTKEGNLAVNTSPDTFIVLDQKDGEFWGTDHNYNHVFGSLSTPEELHHLNQIIIDATLAHFLATE